jgi:hypothetical protein
VVNALAAQILLGETTQFVVHHGHQGIECCFVSFCGSDEEFRDTLLWITHGS